MKDKAAFLVQTVAFNLLIDPAWSKRAFSLSFAGPKRVNDPDSIAAAVFVCSEVAPAAQCFEQLYFEQPHVQRSHCAGRNKEMFSEYLGLRLVHSPALVR